MEEGNIVNNSYDSGSKAKTSMAIRFFSAQEIHKLVCMEDTISLMEQAFSSLSEGKSQVPLRYVPEFKERNLKLLLKPAFSEDLDRCGVKVLTQKEKDPSWGLPTIMGVMLLIDATTGEIISIMDGTSLTALRTGAASGIATKYLAREDAHVAAVFGCGVQGRTQLEAISTVRDIEKVYVYDTNPSAAEEYIDSMQSKIKAEIHFTNDLNLLSGVDIICTATGSETPLFSLDHIKKGVHINGIGSFQPHMQEIDPRIVKASRLYVEQRSTCLDESGDLIKPIRDNIITKDHLIGEIGELFTGKIQGRISSSDITFFKSVGVAIQDLVVANDVYKKSQNQDIGITLEL